MSYQFRLVNCKSFYSKERDITVDYTPVFNIQLQKKMNITPIFNDDHQVTTPGFIIEYEKPAYESNLKYHQQLFDEKIQQTKIKTKQLVSHSFDYHQLIPKPKHRLLICSVCKSSYTDYLTHISSRVHERQFQNSIYIERIKKIGEELKQQPQTYNSISSETEDNSLQEQNPKKKIKTEMSNMISNFLNQ